MSADAVNGIFRMKRNLRDDGILFYISDETEYNEKRKVTAVKQPLITHIQHYSIHDGPGIRTTVFFKGCPLSCRWCHNPETQCFAPTLLFYRERCSGCRACQTCPQGAITWSRGFSETDRSLCLACGACTEACLSGARELCGRPHTIPELVRLLKRDLPFYEESGGGVTLSGGEVLAQDGAFLLELVRRLAKERISVCLDTCGYAPYERIEPLLPWVNLFLYDIKLMDPDLHKQYVGADNSLILQNLRRLSDAGAELWIRMPIIGGVNDSDAHILAVAEFLKTLRFRQMNLLPYHNTGSGKYGRMGSDYAGGAFTVPTQDRLEGWKRLLEQAGIGPVLIGG